MPPRLIVEHSGPAELVLEGENLTPDTLKLYHNGVLYTPLESSDTYVYYLLGDNGTNKVMLNGKTYSTIVVKDIVEPEALPLPMSMAQWVAKGISSGSINSKSIEGNCINYPYLFDISHPIFVLTLGSSANPFTEVDNFGGVNCSIEVEIGASGIRVLASAEVTDPTKPAYITYQGFIIAVFNYTN